MQQAFPTSEPYQVAQKGMKYRFFPFAAEGYPPYHGALVTMQKTIDAKPDMVARFVRATAEGWKSFLADPAPAAMLIKRENPNMTDGEIAFAVQKLKDSQAVTGANAVLTLEAGPSHHVAHGHTVELGDGAHRISIRGDY